MSLWFFAGLANTQYLFAEQSLWTGFYPHGQQFLQVFKADKTVRASLSDLIVPKEFYSDYQKLKKLNEYITPA